MRSAAAFLFLLLLTSFPAVASPLMEGVLFRMEVARGEPLDAAQKSRFIYVAKDIERRLFTARRSFIYRLAKALDVSDGVVLKAIPVELPITQPFINRDALVAALEATLDTKFSDTIKNAVGEIDTERLKDVKATVKEQLKELADISGLPEETVRKLMPPIR